MDFGPLRKLAYAKPFVPYSIQMEGGRVLRATRPFQTMVSPDGKRLIYSDDEGSGRFEHFDAREIKGWKTWSEVSVA